MNLKYSLLYVACRQGKGQFNHAEALMAFTPIPPSCCLFARQANVTCIQNLPAALIQESLMRMKQFSETCTQQTWEKS